MQDWCRNHGGDLPKHPIDEYTVTAVEAAVADLEEQRRTDQTMLKTSYQAGPVKVYWGFDTEVGKLVAMNRAGEASGMTKTCHVSHLSVHPQYGAWLAFRALIIVPDVEGPAASMAFAAGGAWIRAAGMGRAGICTRVD